MPLRRPVRSALPLAAMAAAALLASCADQPKAVAPPPPAAPPIALSSKVVQLASAYRYYLARTTAIDPLFSDGAAVAQSLQVGAAYEPHQMVRGAMAYAAIVALQDDAFVAGVRAYAKDPATRQKVAYEILKDPAYAVGIQGSASAAARVMAALGAGGQKLYDEGKAVKQAAYDIQKQPWSKGEVVGRDARLAGAKSLSSAVMVGDVAETARLEQASTGAGSLQPAAQPVTPAAPPYTPTVIRGLAVAALAALGEAGEADTEQVMALLAEPNIGACMTTSKLNLYQCLAVARPHYEDVFCLGQHAMMDTGRCVIRAAGLPEPYEPRFVPDAESIAKGMPGKKAAPKSRKKS